MGSKGGGGPSGTTTSVQDTSPWGPQQDYLKDIFSSAQGLYRTNTPEYAPTTYATPNLNQTQGLDAAGWQARVNTLPDRIAAMAGQIAGGDLLHSNPAESTFGSLAGSGNTIATNLKSYLSGERLGAGNPYSQALTDSVLSKVVPQIQSRFISGGSLSSPEAARATASGATSAIAPFLFQQQQQEEANQIAATRAEADTRLQAAAGASDTFKGGVNDMLRAIALAPAANQDVYGRWDRLTQAGTGQQQLEQQAINDAVARWNFGEELPYNQLNNYIGAVTGNYGGTTSLTQPYFKPPQQGILGSLGQGVGILGGINSLSGGALGTGLGTLFGML
jgi:hypothetical protein